MTDDLEASRKRISFLALYGLFLSSWSMFETLMEFLIMRQLRLKPREASIICAPLGAGAKRNLLVSLLNRKPRNHDQAIRLINEAIQIAQRNSFAHGFFRVELETAIYMLLTRDVKDTYSAKAKLFDYRTMNDQLNRFAQKSAEIQQLFGVSDDDLNAYTAQIEDHAITLASRDKRPPRRHPNSSKAKRKSRPLRGR